MSVCKQIVVEAGDPVVDFAPEGVITFFECLCETVSPSVHVLLELFEAARETPLFVPRLLLISECESFWKASWLCNSEDDQICISQVILFIESSGNPAVSTPSHEASVSIEEERPEVEDESNQFKHESLVPEHDMERNQYYVEDPDEHVGTWLAEAEEN